MKFAEHLTAHLTPEWRKQYIQYEEMKTMLYNAIDSAPSSDASDPEAFRRYYTNFDEQFFLFCEKELKKIDTFYSEKLAESTRKYDNLSSELSEMIAANNKSDSKFERKVSIMSKNSNLLPKKNLSSRKLQEIKLAFSEFYLSLVLLQNYQNLNYTGFRKILKKYDKLLSTDLGAKWRLEHVENSHFYTNKEIDTIIRETEDVFIQCLEGGDRQKAMKRLRVPPLGEKQSPWTTFKVGLFSGSLFVLFFVIVFSVIHKGQEDWRVVCRLYRGPLILIIAIFLWGVNIYGWRSSGVNHVLIFELNPRNHLSEQEVIEIGAIFGVIWCLSLLLFLYSDVLKMPPYVSPLILYGSMFAFLINPTRTFQRDARYWALKVLFRIFLSPLFHVGFADFWLADQLNSLSIVFLDIQYFVCLYLTNWNLNVVKDANYCVDKFLVLRSIIRCLPAWFRFAQCLRRLVDHKSCLHFFNSLKYATTFFVVIFSALEASYSNDKTFRNIFLYLWIIASIVSSLYAYYWDVKMDWGLFETTTGDNKYLREEIVYSSTMYYYVSMVEDFILRFSWAVLISLIEMGFVHADLIITISAPIEVFRRFIWNFFRLENEHLNNCGNFRAVRDISITPADRSDQAQLIRMMDEEDGVVHRRKRKTILSRKKNLKYPIMDDDSNDDINTTS